MCADPLLTLRIFHMFGCREFKQSHDEPTENESWHRYDYSIDCNSSEYLGFRTLAQVMIVVYPVGIPAFVLWIFHRNSGRLTDESLLAPASTLDNTIQPEEDAMEFSSSWSTAQKTPPWWYGNRTTFNFMVRDFQPRYYFFEVVEFGRKLGLTGLVMIIEPGSVMQICVAITIAFGFAAAYAVIRPYADPRANYMRLLADTSLFFTLLCILVLHFVDSLSPCDPLTNSFIGWFLIVMNFVLLLVYISAEMVRRAVRIYADSFFVGISYRPDEPLNLQIDNQFSTGLIQATNAAANVYRGAYKATISAEPVPCAVKIRSKHRDGKVLGIEAAIMLRCNHPNIVRIYHIEEIAGVYYLCTELCSELSVEIAVLRGKVKSMDARINLCRSMLEGLQAFHSGGFVHGNCTPSNFVLGEDGVPRLCGFSSSNMLHHAAAATKFDTIGGTVGYMPSEIIKGRRVSMTVEVANPIAVDIFSLGVTTCFVLSNGSLPFRSDLATTTVERNIQTGSHGVDDIHALTPEAKHLIAQMVNYSPGKRRPVAYLLEHPLFWDLKRKVKYLGETVGSVLPPRKHKSEVPFIADLEEQMDSFLGGPFNEHDPASGTSWARLLDPRYPLAGKYNDGWGSGKMAQRPPAEVELHYAIYGAPAKPKQVKEREGLLADGKPLGPHVAKEVRSVGLLKFIRNLDTHAGQMVNAGRFESEDALRHYLLDPFPWLLMAVYAADERHRLTATQATKKVVTATTPNPLSAVGGSFTDPMALSLPMGSTDSDASIAASQSLGPAVVADGAVTSL